MAFYAKIFICKYNSISQIQYNMNTKLFIHLIKIES